jgi:CheY-like chemotaxis protein
MVEQNSLLDSLKDKLKVCAENKSILIVDDEPVTRKIITTALEKFFSNVVSAIDGQEALEKYKENGGFDIIISDILMPNMDGLDFSKEIKKINKEQPIIIITSVNDNELFFKLIDIGIEYFIHKPFELPKMATKIIDILDDNFHQKSTRHFEDDVLTKMKYLKSSDRELNILNIEKHSEETVENIEEVIDETLSAKYFMSSLRNDENWEEYKSLIKNIMLKVEELEYTINALLKLNSKIVNNNNLNIAETILVDIARLFLDIAKDMKNFKSLEEVSYSIENISKFFYINRDLKGFSSKQIQEFLELDFLIDDIKDFIASVFVTEKSQNINSYINIFNGIVEILEVSILNAEKIKH